MKKIITLLLLNFILFTGLKAQVVNLNPDKNGDPWWAGGLLEPTSNVEDYIDSMPKLILSSESATIELPDSVDNSQQPYMRQIFIQQGGSCTHAASIGYVFTYEMNYARGLSSKNIANQYPTHFSYNFWNKGYDTTGTYIFTGSYIARKMGIPNVCVWDNECDIGGDPRKWMSGYEKYQNALTNRLEWSKAICFWWNYGNPSITLETLKHWLNDHNEGADVGGIAYFGTYVADATYKTLPNGTSNSGKHILTITGTTGGHVMTIVGYNDSIKYDYNNDGYFTNNQDWAGLYDAEGNPMPDGILDLRDWEIGAFKVANSWGEGWPTINDEGYVYLGYRQLIEHLQDGTDAIQGHNVYVQKAIGTHTHGIELNVKLEYTSRDKLIMRFNNKDFPGFVDEYGSWPMQGVNEQPIEMVVDGNYFLEENFKRIRFNTIANSPDHSGIIHNYSITDTRWNEEFTLAYNQHNIPIIDGSYSYYIDYDLIPFQIEEDMAFSINKVSRFSPTVSNNSILNIGDNVQIDMYSSSLIIEEGSTLHIGDNVIFNGENGKNSIIVYGNLEINGNVSFNNCNITVYGNIYFTVGAGISSPDEQDKMSITLRGSEDVSVQDVNFSNLIISGTADLEITRCVFTNTNFVKYGKGDISINNSRFYNSNVDFSYSVNRTGFVNIRNCNFMNYSGNAVINIDQYPTYIIENNSITNNNSIGIAIYNSGNHPLGQHFISDNTILDNYALPGQKPTSGIRIYNSVANIASNTISGNNYGISCNHNSKIMVYGDKELIQHGIYQMVYDNTNNQVIAIDNSFPFVFEYNVIHSYVNNNPLIDCSNNGPFSQGHFDVRNNCWRDDFRPQDALNPYNMFIYNPVWDCGIIPHDAPVNTPKELYRSAVLDIKNQNYSIANTKLKQIVTDYPDSKYATASLKDMVDLTSISSEDYEALKEYFDSEPIIVSNNQLKKLSGYLKNDCEIKQKNYTVALQFYENIISNPPTIEDSIYAAIDAGHLYYLIEEEENKTDCIWKIPEMKPKTKETYIRKREDLLSMLKGKRSTDKTDFDLFLLKNYFLFQNTPNPFSSKTEIKYIINIEAYISIKLFNNLGKRINTYVNKKMEKGKYSVFINSNNIKNGIYYYGLEIDGKLIDIKKMVIIH